jgi:hypothetical protein
MSRAEQPTPDEQLAPGLQRANRPTAEQLRAQLESLRSQIPLLPSPTQAEFLPLVDALERRLRPDQPRPAEVAQLLVEIDAIDKCVRFEVAISLAEFTARSPEAGSADNPRRRLDPPENTEPHRHSITPVPSEADVSRESV